MLYEMDINFLIGKWALRAEENPQSDYSIATKECIEELRNLMERTHFEESQEVASEEQKMLDSMTPEELHDYFMESQADYQLSSLEGQEKDWLYN